MRRNQAMPSRKMLFVAIIMSLFFVGTSQAQADLPVYGGKFTLAYQVHWGKSVLEPGDYTITVQSTGTPTIALITKADGDGIRVVTGVRSGPTNGVNALLLRQKNGQLRVYALALASLGEVLVYDRALANEEVIEARSPQTIPVILAKR